MRSKHDVRNRVLLTALLALLSVSTLAAQQGAAEARGLVTDHEGNPLPDVVVSFVNDSAPEVDYTAKTNKKGRFYLANLLYYANNTAWSVRVEAAGRVPTHVNVESRTQAALVDKFERDLPPGAELPKIRIRAFGKVIYDVVLTPADQVAELEPAAAAQPVVVENAAAPRGAPQDPWDAAVRAANAGNFEDSVPLFQKAVDKSSDDVERRTAFAKVLYQLERHGEAARQAMEATRLAPDSLDAQMVLYSVYVATENLDGAQATLDRAQQIAPQDLRVLQQLAFIADRRGDRDQAIAAHEAIIAVQPDNVEAWIALGGLYADAGRLGDSETAYGKVAELKPDSAYQVFYNIGALIMNRPNLSEADTNRAVGAFRRAVEIKPDYAQAHQQLAFALLGTGDLKGAGNALQRYLELRPDAPDAADMRAVLEGLRP